MVQSQPRKNGITKRTQIMELVSRCLPRTEIAERVGVHVRYVYKVISEERKKARQRIEELADERYAALLSRYEQMVSQLWQEAMGGEEVNLSALDRLIIVQRDLGRLLKPEDQNASVNLFVQQILQYDQREAEELTRDLRRHLEIFDELEKEQRQREEGESHSRPLPLPEK